ncbi:PRTRC system ThiF family protein [Sphingobacterium lactis]|uniref:PRTRC system ThiF family protein n=1 Tax=Sphingobacterium TaxID=28453 RepID=UPI0021A7CB1A|nr:PRTRC system ThiF family protein [Sphingobacterium hotanense]MCT1526054.1 PRTRC system ThiF family protein [Sphingobacterium hotanense]
MKKNKKTSVNKNKQTVHFINSYLLNPTNPISVNLIGIGGTGSSMLMALARINKSLITLRHAGLHVVAYDADKVEEPNLGRQLFTEAELGLNKAVASINRVNRGFGFNWKAVPENFISSSDMASITITCVDNVTSRLQVADCFSKNRYNHYHYSSRQYWMDCGNDKETGQVLLSTIGEHDQPQSEKYHVQGSLPLITDEYGILLRESEMKSTTPSCSLAEALEQQDLFINTNIANIGASLIWKMFRKGMIKNRGFFINLEDFRMQPIKINAPTGKKTCKY